MNSISSSSSLQNNLVFRMPEKIETSHIENIAKCIISDCSRWNFDPGHSDKSIMNATYPCVAELNHSMIVINWAILQLMRIYDLTYNGFKVSQSFTKPRFQNNPATYLVNAFAKSKLGLDFDIKKGIKKQFKCDGKKFYYHKFFEQQRGKNAVDVFRLILLKKNPTFQSFSSSGLGKRSIEQLNTTSNPPSKRIRRSAESSNASPTAPNTLKIELTSNSRNKQLGIHISSKIFQTANFFHYYAFLKLIPRNILQDHLLQGTNNKPVENES